MSALKMAKLALQQDRERERPSIFRQGGRSWRILVRFRRWRWLERGKIFRFDRLKRIVERGESSNSEF